MRLLRSVELSLRFSTISPPAMMTGFIRSRRKGSVNWGLPPRLSWEVRPDTAPRGGLMTPLLRRRMAPRRPYPSCPVPAAGPFLAPLSFLSAGCVTSAAGADFFRPKKGKRELNVDTFGLGVLTSRLGCVAGFLVASEAEPDRDVGATSCPEGRRRCPV